MMIEGRCTRGNGKEAADLEKSVQVLVSSAGKWREKVLLGRVVLAKAVARRRVKGKRLLLGGVVSGQS